MLSDVIREGVMDMAEELTKWDLSYYTLDDRAQIRACLVELMDIAAVVGSFPKGSRGEELENGKGEWDPDDAKFLDYLKRRG